MLHLNRGQDTFKFALLSHYRIFLVITLIIYQRYKDSAKHFTQTGFVISNSKMVMVLLKQYKPMVEVLANSQRGADSPFAWFPYVDCLRAKKC